MPRVHRLMDENSWFMSFFFADDHPDKRYMKRNEGVTWLEPQAEVFGGAQWVTLLDESHVRTLFAPFTIVDMYKRTLHSLMRDEPFTGNSEWIVICKKK